MQPPKSYLFYLKKLNVWEDNFYFSLKYLPVFKFILFLFLKIKHLKKGKNAEEKSLEGSRETHCTPPDLTFYLNI